MNTVKNFTAIKFLVKLDRCVGNCHTITDLFNKIFSSKKNREFKSVHVQHYYWKK